MRRLLVMSLAVLLGCADNAGQRAVDQLAALQKKKAETAAHKNEKPEAPLKTVVQLPAPFDDTQATVIVPDGPCPEGFWALFPGDPPGGTLEEKTANNAKRKQLVDALRAKKYLVKLMGKGQVDMLPYDAPSGKIAIEVTGTIDCHDSVGHVALAWTEVKAIDPGNSAAKGDADFRQHVWSAQPTRFEQTIASMTAAKEFTDKYRFGISARVGFELGAVEIDKKKIKVGKFAEKVANEDLSFGGGVEDWGAGRLVRVKLLGLRVAGEQEKKMLFETGPAK